MTLKLKKEVSDLRTKIAELKEELESIDEGRLPRELVEQHLDDVIATHAQQGRLPVIYLAEGQRMPSLDAASSFDLLCWIDPQSVRTRICAELDRLYDDGNPGLDPAKRAAEQQRIELQVFDLEVEEERLITRAAEAGYLITRRADANPAAVLEA